MSQQAIQPDDTLSRAAEGGAAGMPARPEVKLRRAQREDQTLINAMVRDEANLDPTSLHWSHFVIAELPGEGGTGPAQVAGIGQIRPYRGCPELGSLYVRQPYRGQGIASQIVRALLASTPAPIYLECVDLNVPYYRRFGFYEIAWHRAPWPLWLKSGMGRLAGRLGMLPRGRTVATMRWDGPPAGGGGS